jgi:hypothetical protein
MSRFTDSSRARIWIGILIFISIFKDGEMKKVENYAPLKKKERKKR